ncbi:MAG: hypothetical protein E7253_07600 [Lachnospiraceae bacterium]|nr:hypothetical protein [Lachnospiraceae bacterium]
MKKQDRKVLSVLFITVLWLISLCGCTLAEKEAGGEQTKDRLIGGMVTREAVAEKTFATVEAPGEEGYLWGMDFEGVKGECFFYREVEQEDGQIVLSGHNGAANFVKKEDGNQEIEVSGRFYIAPVEGEEVMEMHLNPLYQTEDGMLYIMPGPSASLGLGMNMPGTSNSLTVDEERKETFGRKEQADKIAVRADFEVVYEPVSLSFSQFNKENEFLRKEEYDAKDVPFEYLASSDAEYVMLEIEMKKPDGTIVCERQIHEWDGQMMEYTNSRGEVYKPEKETSVYYYQAKDDGFMEKKLCFIKWRQE